MRRPLRTPRQAHSVRMASRTFPFLLASDPAGAPRPRNHLPPCVHIPSELAPSAGLSSDLAGIRVLFTPHAMGSEFPGRLAASSSSIPPSPHFGVWAFPLTPEISFDSLPIGRLAPPDIRGGVVRPRRIQRVALGEFTGRPRSTFEGLPLPIPRALHDKLNHRFPIRNITIDPDECGCTGPDAGCLNA